MNLDSRTIIFVIILGSSLMGAGLLTVTRGRLLGDVPGASHWACGTLLQALGWAITGALRGTVNEVFSIVVGAALLQLSLTQYLIVLHQWTGRPTRAGWLHALVVVQVAGLFLFSAVIPDFRARQVVLCACAGCVALRSAYVLFRGQERRLVSHVVAASLFALCGTVLTARGFIYLVLDPFQNEGLFTVNIINSVSFLSYYLVAVLLTFCFVLMCSERYADRRQQVEERFRQAALTDPLTRLPNRAMITDRLRQLVATSAEPLPALYAVLFIDLDNFKYVNDSLGHDVGDELLIMAADRLTGTLRQNDDVARMCGSIAGRFGGDEFVVVLERIEEPAHAVAVAERILAVMTEPFQLAAQTLNMRCSIGISTSALSCGGVDDLLRDADTAMYQAKAAGKANYLMFDESMHRRAKLRFRLENDLRDAIGTGQIYAVYQPIVDLVSGRVAAFEALARWDHPVRGAIAPSEFIPIAEETGLILPIGQLIMEQAVATLERLNAIGGGQAVAMNVNVSRRQLIDARFPALVESVVKTLSVPPDRLRLEITESAVSGASALILAVLNQIKALGVQIYLDDFGTGLSSLSLLRAAPLDGLKIDPSFIDAASGDRQAITILNAVAVLGHNLGKTVTAEGISEPRQVAIILALEYDMAQGYLFGYPMSAADAEAAIFADFSSYYNAA